MNSIDCLLQNDEYYPMWLLQLYFTITELAVALGLLVLCDASIPISPATGWLIVTISGGHMLRTPMDQFVKGALNVCCLFDTPHGITYIPHCTTYVSRTTYIRHCNHHSSSAANGVLLMWMSDVIVCVVTLTLLTWEARGANRQGCAYPLIRCFIGARTAGGTASHASQSEDAEVAFIEGGVGGDDVHCKPSRQDTSSNLPSSVFREIPSQLHEVLPVYSKRWLLADGAIALAVALTQVWLIGRL